MSELTTTTTSDLLKLGKGLKNLRIFAQDDLPKKITSGSYIINLDSKTGPGTHWVGAYYGPKQEYAVYVDPFGGIPPPLVEKFLKTGSKRVIYFTLQAQDLESTSCGYHVIWYLKMLQKGLSPSEILVQLNGEDQSENEEMLNDYFLE